MGANPWNSNILGSLEISAGGRFDAPGVGIVWRPVADILPTIYGKHGMDARLSACKLVASSLRRRAAVDPK